MKELQIKKIILLFLIFTSISVAAQSDNNTLSNEQKKAETNQKASSSQSALNYELSEYMNMEADIKLRSVSGKIPTSFPKYVQGQTKEQYMGIIKEWVKNHLDSVKKEYQAELLSNKKSVNRNKKAR